MQVVAQDESIKRSAGGPVMLEDDEAVEVAEGKQVGKSSEMLSLGGRMNQQDKKKHWLLDSDRFDHIVMQTNAQNQGESQVQTGEDDVRVIDQYEDDES